MLCYSVPWSFARLGNRTVRIPEIVKLLRVNVVRAFHRIFSRAQIPLPQNQSNSRPSTRRYRNQPAQRAHQNTARLPVEIYSEQTDGCRVLPARLETFGLQL